MPKCACAPDLLRFLALGGDGAAPVHERRLEVHGAYVEEDLNLAGGAIPQPLMFEDCYFAERIILRDADTKSRYIFLAATLSRCSPKVCECVAEVFLQSGFHCSSGVNSNHATIEGPVSFEGSTFQSNGNFAVSCERARVAGEADLNNAFVGEGGVFLKGAEIGGESQLRRGNIPQPRRGWLRHCARLQGR